MSPNTFIIDGFLPVYRIVAFLVCIFLPLSTMAGPPFRTDDPEPVEYHHWEFYCASQITSVHESVSGTAPLFEINYGIFPETQMHVIVPFSFNHPQTGNSSYGPGDIEIGLKYRFINETLHLPQMGVFPLIEIPSGNAEKGLGAGTMQFFFPVWLQKSWGPWTSYGGGGCLFPFKSNRINSWFVGWEGQRDFLKIITIGAEVFGTIVPSESPENEAAFTIGALVNFSDYHHFLFSAGRDMIGKNDLSLYAAYQLTIGQASK
jgi:hypothetical protein